VAAAAAVPVVAQVAEDEAQGKARAVVVEGVARPLPVGATSRAEAARRRQMLPLQSVMVSQPVLAEQAAKRGGRLQESSSGRVASEVR
jgi:hypothetical protein